MTVPDITAIVAAEAQYWGESTSPEAIGGMGAAANILAAIHGHRAGWHPVPAAEPETIGAVLGHCSTCRHWGTMPGDRGNPKLRACTNPKHVQGYGSAAVVPDDGVIVENDEGWGFETGPNFGCVNHQP